MTSLFNWLIQSWLLLTQHGQAGTKQSPDSVRGQSLSVWHLRSSDSNMKLWLSCDVVLCAVMQSGCVIYCILLCYLQITCEWVCVVQDPCCHGQTPSRHWLQHDGWWSPSPSHGVRPLQLSQPLGGTAEKTHRGPHQDLPKDQWGMK